MEAVPSGRVNVSSRVILRVDHSLSLTVLESELGNFSTTQQNVLCRWSSGCIAKVSN